MFAGTGADVVRLSPGGATVGTPSRARPNGKEGAEQAQERRQDGDASQCPHVAPQPLALHAMGQRDGSLEIGCRPAPAADRRQRHSCRRARVPLTMIESLAAIEFSLVQSIEKSGRELGRNNPMPSESSQPLEQHAQSQGRHRPSSRPM